MKSPTWTPQEKKVALFILVCALGGLIALSLRLSGFMGAGTRAPFMPTPVNWNLAAIPTPPPRPRVVLDLNEATEKDLARLPTLSPALAHKIIEYRNAHGPYGSVGELRDALGAIGPRRFEAILQNLEVKNTPPNGERETSP